jgi:hypothetical protein
LFFGTLKLQQIILKTVNWINTIFQK